MTGTDTEELLGCGMKGTSHDTQVGRMLQIKGVLGNETQLNEHGAVFHQMRLGGKGVVLLALGIQYSCRHHRALNPRDCSTIRYRRTYST